MISEVLDNLYCERLSLSESQRFITVISSVNEEKILVVADITTTKPRPNP